MAGWSELFESEPKARPRLTFLCFGDISSLVLDKVMQALQEYKTWVRVENPIDMSTSTGSNTAYLLVDPSQELLDFVQRFIREGGSESYFVLMSQEVKTTGNPSLEYIKRKAQQCKSYYSISAPRTDSARDKMVSFFLLRWAVTRETSHRVVSSLSYSPGELYQFDRQFLLATGGVVLPSTETHRIVNSLLGADTPSMVVSEIVYGSKIDAEFSPEFNRKVMAYLQSSIHQGLLIQAAWRNGSTNPTDIAKDTGLTKFQVTKSTWAAEMFEPHQLRRGNKILQGLLGFEDSPEFISVLSRVWRA